MLAAKIYRKIKDTLCYFIPRLRLHPSFPIYFHFYDTSLFKIYKIYGNINVQTVFSFSQRRVMHLKSELSLRKGKDNVKINAKLECSCIKADKI